MLILRTFLRYATLRAGVMCSSQKVGLVEVGAGLQVSFKLRKESKCVEFECQRQSYACACALELKGLDLVAVSSVGEYFVNEEFFNTHRDWLLIYR
jgi:hypothetical protein